MSSHEFSEWIAFARLEPLGEFRADVRTAMLMALLANINRDDKKHRQPYQVEDFLPKFSETTEKETDPESQMLAWVTMLNAAMGGKDLRQ